MRYELAPDIDDRVFDIVSRLKMEHINLARGSCIRSFGTNSKYVLARCHTLSKIFQKAMGIKAHYIIEVLSENFDNLDFEDQTRVIIHELMHIPQTFGGGFKQHPLVNKRTVEKMYQKYKE